MVSDGCIMLLPESLSPGEQLEGLRGLNMVDISQISAPKIILGPPNCSPGPQDSGRSIMQPSETIIYQSITIQ